MHESDVRVALGAAVGLGQAVDTSGILTEHPGQKQLAVNSILKELEDWTDPENSRHRGGNWRYL